MSDGRWDDAPCGLASLDDEGLVVDANDTLLRWLGRSRQDVVGRVRLPNLLTAGGRMYWETHLRPLLVVERRFDEVALELATPQGRLPVVASASVAASGQRTDVALLTSRERARYERELRAAREAAERSAAQTRALQHATAALSRALGVEGVAMALLSAAVGTLGAAAATLWLAKPEGVLGAAMSRGEPSGSQPPPRMVDVARQRSAMVSEGRVLVPLHGQSTLQGALSLAPSSDPGAEEVDLDVLTAVGLQAGLALERAQLYEQSASVAHELQQSLLAIEPPDDPRYAVAAAYRPGVERLEVGGDWYDVFLAADGVLAFEAGDVVGRGLEAASAMGQLRSAVRAVAGPGETPSGLLSRLDRFVQHSEAAALATLAYAELDLATGEVRYSCAGHPPPLLLPAAGAPRLLWDGRSTPLGAFSRPIDRPQGSLRLQEGDRLLLYTDGLVERRDRALDVGLEVLLDASATTHDLPLDTAVRRLTRTMLDDEASRDDVCVLMLSWVGGHFERQLSANLQSLSAIRHALDEWLAVRDVDDRTRRDVVLAASESLANAAEHGAGGRAEEFVQVRAWVVREPGAPGHVLVTVHDRGHWRSNRPSAERGRGLRIVDALVDEVSVTRDDPTHPDGGTTVVLRRTLPGGQP